jgi:16S rRNA (guanine966-N2)-methyltransferase
MTGRLRISGGALARRLIPIPDAARRGELRPTADKVREALCSILHSRLAGEGRSFEGLVVADLCCGSGALGFEALSRGAAHCCFVDVDRRTLEVVAASARALGVAERATFVGAAVHRALGGRGPFDLVFFDPPYAMVLDDPLRLALARAVAPGGLLVVERSARGTDPPIEGLSPVDERRYGDTRLSLYRRDTLEPA